MQWFIIYFFVSISIILPLYIHLSIHGNFSNQRRKFTKQYAREFLLNLLKKTGVYALHQIHYVFQTLFVPHYCLGKRARRSLRFINGMHHNCFTKYWSKVRGGKKKVCTTVINFVNLLRVWCSFKLSQFRTVIKHCGEIYY